LALDSVRSLSRRSSGDKTRGGNAESFQRWALSQVAAWAVNEGWRFGSVAYRSAPALITSGASTLILAQLLNFSYICF